MSSPWMSRPENFRRPQHRHVNTQHVGLPCSTIPSGFSAVSTPTTVLIAQSPVLALHHVHHPPCNRIDLPASPSIPCPGSRISSLTTALLFPLLAPGGRRFWGQSEARSMTLRPAASFEGH